MRSAATTTNFKRISIALILSGMAGLSAVAFAVSSPGDSGVSSVLWEIIFILCAVAAAGAFAWAARCVWSGHFFSRLASAFANIGSWIFCVGIPIVIAAWVYTIISSFPLAGGTAFLALIAPPALIYLPTLITFSITAANRRAVSQTVMGYVE